MYDVIVQSQLAEHGRNLDGFWLCRNILQQRSFRLCDERNKYQAYQMRRLRLEPPCFYTVVSHN